MKKNMDSLGAKSSSKHIKTIGYLGIQIKISALSLFNNQPWVVYSPFKKNVDIISREDTKKDVLTKKKSCISCKVK